MYKCNECERVFDYPSTRSVSSEFWGVIQTDTFEVCPYCEEDDFCEIEEGEDG